LGGAGHRRRNLYGVVIQLCVLATRNTHAGIDRRSIVTKPNPQAPIGIFDSGVGGLTVARAIIDQLPDEDIVYVGDTANSPYGPKPIAQVRRLALTIMDELVDAGVKLL